MRDVGLLPASRVTQLGESDVHSLALYAPQTSQLRNLT